MVYRSDRLYFKIEVSKVLNVDLLWKECFIFETRQNFYNDLISLVSTSCCIELLLFYNQHGNTSFGNSMVIWKIKRHYWLWILNLVYLVYFSNDRFNFRKRNICGIDWRAHITSIPIYKKSKNDFVQLFLKIEHRDFVPTVQFQLVKQCLKLKWWYVQLCTNNNYSTICTLAAYYPIKQKFIHYWLAQLCLHCDSNKELTK